MLKATLCFAMMNIFIKAVAHYPAMEIVFFRCGVSLLFCVGYLYKEKVSLKGTNRKLLALRGIFGTISLFAYIVTIANMPLGTAVTIQYLSPIFTTILAIFILDEKVRPLHWLFFIISFSGVVMIKGFDENVALYYLVIGILAATGSACAYVTIRTMKNLEHPVVVVFHFQLIGTITGGIFSASDFVIPQGTEWISLFLLGLFTQLGQVNMTKSLQMENVANVSILNYIGVIYAVLSGVLLFNEQYKFGTLFGMLLVIAGVVFSVLYTRNKNKAGT